jgi:hypothetical protein
MSKEFKGKHSLRSKRKPSPSLPIATEELEGAPRKRVHKSPGEPKNPYETIPELPHITLTEQEMTGDPI